MEAKADFPPAVPFDAFQKDMCRDCQTFLWGGTGISLVDADGGCTFVCEGEGWLEYNILGVPSCVPSKAHELFGALGVIFAMASLCHSGYHLVRQVGDSRPDMHTIPVQGMARATRSTT